MGFNNLLFLYPADLNFLGKNEILVYSSDTGSRKIPTASSSLTPQKFIHHTFLVRFEVLTVVVIKCPIFCDKAQQIIESRGARAGFNGPPLTSSAI
jgi:hypothetical protein